MEEYAVTSVDGAFARSRERFESIVAGLGAHRCTSSPCTSHAFNLRGWGYRQAHGPCAAVRTGAVVRWTLGFASALACAGDVEVS